MNRSLRGENLVWR